MRRIINGRSLEGIRRLGLGLAVLGIVFPSITLAQTYRVVDLGALDGGASSAYGIDSAGVVAGASSSVSGRSHPVILREGQPVEDLGLLPGGDRAGEHANNHAAAISDNGTYVTGSSYRIFPNEPFSRERRGIQGFIWSRDGGMSPVGSLCDHSTGGGYACSQDNSLGDSEARAVNDRGEVVGQSQWTGPWWHEHAFIWRDGNIEPLFDSFVYEDAAPPDVPWTGSGYSASRAFGLSNGGVVVGDFTLVAEVRGPGDHSPFNRRAFAWRDGQSWDLGALSGHNASSALAVVEVNDSVRIAGWSGMVEGKWPLLGEAELAEGDWTNAVLWVDGMIQNLGTLSGDQSSKALALNHQGQVVGWSGNRAFLWQDGIMQDLNDLLVDSSGWERLIEATGINNDGWISGTGIKEGQLRAFILAPAASEPPPVDPAPVDPPPADPPPAVPSPNPEPPVRGPAAPPGAGNSWPAPYNGITPDPARGLGLNNIGIYHAQDQLIYTCVNILTHGAPDTLDGNTQIDIALEILDLEEGLIRVVRSRPFNPGNALNEAAQRPDCSGRFETSTNRYEDIVQYEHQTLRATFELSNETTLELRLLTLIDL